MAKSGGGLSMLSAKKISPVIEDPKIKEEIQSPEKVIENTPTTEQSLVFQQESKIVEKKIETVKQETPDSIAGVEVTSIEKMLYTAFELNPRKMQTTNVGLRNSTHDNLSKMIDIFKKLHNIDISKGTLVDNLVTILVEENKELLNKMLKQATKNDGF